MNDFDSAPIVIVNGAFGQSELFTESINVDYCEKCHSANKYSDYGDSNHLR